MGDLLGSLIWGAKSGQYCVIGGGSLHEICVIALKIFLFCGLRSLMANSALDSTYKHVEWHCKLSSLSPCVVVGPVGD